MSGRNGHKALDENQKREIDSDFVWRWICRGLVIFLVVYWTFNGLEPTERWLGLIMILLGINEFVRVKKDPDEKSVSITLGKSKRDPKPGNHGKGEPPTLLVDWGIMVFAGFI